jgi:hypothetical protein
VSLYTCLNLLNQPGVNISTVEDPAEINLPGINQVNVNDKAGLKPIASCTVPEAREMLEASAELGMPMAPAVTEAPRAIGTPRKAGYQDNVAMSMDDVKKMLNPNAYARGTGITE